MYTVKEKKNEIKRKNEAERRERRTTEESSKSVDAIDFTVAVCCNCSGYWFHCVAKIKIFIIFMAHFFFLLLLLLQFWGEIGRFFFLNNVSQIFMWVFFCPSAHFISWLFGTKSSRQISGEIKTKPTHSMGINIWNGFGRTQPTNEGNQKMMTFFHLHSRFWCGTVIARIPWLLSFELSSASFFFQLMALLSRMEAVVSRYEMPHLIAMEFYTLRFFSSFFLSTRLFGPLSALLRPETRERERKRKW